MKQTIAALFGVIAMACASDYPNPETTSRRQNQLPPSVPDGVVKKFKEGNQVKKDVELNLQEISEGLPFLLDGQEISFEDVDLDLINIFMADAEVVVDGARQTPLSRVFKSKKDPAILIVKDTNGNLISATKADKTTGKSTKVNLIAKGGKDVIRAQRSFSVKDAAKVLEAHETEKKRKNLASCLERARSFFHSVPGLRRWPHYRQGSENLSSLLADSEVCGYGDARMSIATVRATYLCMRGSRIPTYR
jgi:hypothetical protein